MTPQKRLRKCKRNRHTGRVNDFKASIMKMGKSHVVGETFYYCNPTQRMLPNGLVLTHMGTCVRA